LRSTHTISDEEGLEIRTPNDSKAILILIAAHADIGSSGAPK
jgi:hypothetical protein